MKAKIYYYIPENLDIEELQKVYPPTFKFNIHKAQLFISEISTLRIHDKNKDGWAKMSSVILQRLIQDYGKYRAWLETIGVIKLNNSYVASSSGNGQSKKYTFTIQYQGKVRRVPVEYKVHRKRMLRHLGTKQKNNKIKFDKVFLNNKLKIDEAKAHGILRDKYEADIKKGMALIKASNSYNGALIKVDKLNNGDFFYTTDSTIRRHYSTITSFPRILRGLLTYDGEQLIELDYSNAQFLFFVRLMSPNFWVDNMFPKLCHDDTVLVQDYMFTIHAVGRTVIERLSSHINTNRLKNSVEDVEKWRSFSSSIYMLGELIQLTDTKEYDSYRDLVESGSLYNYLQEEFGKSSSYYKNLARGKFKVKVISYMNARNRTTSVFHKLFTREFPTISKFITSIKKIHYLIYSHVLLNLETMLMFDRVIPTIKLSIPDDVIYTIHDCVLCTKNNEHFIRNVMEEQVVIALGVNPTVR